MLNSGRNLLVHSIVSVAQQPGIRFSFMTRPLNQRIRQTRLRTGRAKTALLLLLSLVCLPASGAASHYCFDGLEPPVSIHFDNFSGHDDHDDEEAQHVDLEKPVLDDNLVSKHFQNLDFTLLYSFFEFTPSPGFVQYTAGVSSNSSARSSIWFLRSPLRAPPTIS